MLDMKTTLGDLVRMGDVYVSIAQSASHHHMLSGHTISTHIKDDDVVKYAHMGGLNRFQEEAVRYYVRNQLVYDLGAGLLGWAEKLAQFGAEHVTAVDDIYKDPRENVLNNCRAWKKCEPANVTLDDRSFREFHRTGPNALHTAFIAWPHNTYGKTMGLELLASKAKTVIYIGKNLDGTACGSPHLWDHLSQRKVLCFLPAVRNSLIVYGRVLKEPRQLLREEKGALDGPWDSMLYSPPEYPQQ
jgi:hypothetical protein